MEEPIPDNISDPYEHIPIYHVMTRIRVIVPLDPTYPFRSCESIGMIGPTGPTGRTGDAGLTCVSKVSYLTMRTRSFYTKPNYSNRMPIRAQNKGKYQRHR